MKRAILATAVMGTIALALASPGLSSWALGGGGGVIEPVSGDVNGDGTLSISDPVYMLRFLFSGGPAPVEPQEPEASPELVAAIQSAAARVEEILSTVDTSSPAQAALTDIIMTGVLQVREMSSWPRSRAFELAGRMTLATLLAHDPIRIRDYDCADRCTSTYQTCRNNCGGNPDCEFHCDVNYALCLVDCNQ